MSRNVQVRDVPDPVHDELTRQAHDAGLSLNRFMLAELGNDAMQFQVLSRSGQPIDSGSLPLAEEPKKAAESTPPSR